MTAEALYKNLAILPCTCPSKAQDAALGDRCRAYIRISPTLWHCTNCPDVRSLPTSATQTLYEVWNGPTTEERKAT